MSRQIGITTVGNAFLDRILFVPAPILGPGKMRATAQVETGGGIAATAAVTCARLGARAQLISRCGLDAAGDRLKALLETYEVETGQLRRFEGGETQQGTIIVAPDGERNAIGFMGRGLIEDPGWIDWSVMDHSAAVMGDCSWPDATEIAFAKAREVGALSVLDADVGDMAAVERLFTAADHVIFSEACILRLTGRDTIREAIADCAARTPAQVGVTAGAAGFHWLENGALRHLPAFRVVARDTNGAGDIFHGAYTLGLAEGRSVEQAARLASAAAALKCQAGSGWESIPGRDETNTLSNEEKAI